MAIFRLAALIFLFLFPGFCFGHQALIVIDADGNRVGELVEHYRSGKMRVLTDDGYLLRLDQQTGLISNLSDDVAGFYYESDDCSGQAYVHPSMVIPEIVEGGHIVYIGTHPDGQPAITLIDWFPVASSIPINSRGKPGRCTSAPITVPVIYKATSIDPATYKIRQMGAYDEWGYRVPFSVEQERPDGMFCNGFESCPTIEGPPGYTSLISQAPLDLGDAHCEAGGVSIRSGIDNNPVNGILDDDEVEAIQYICNGVINLPPMADADGPYNATLGGAIVFDGSSSTDPNGDTLTYAWDFGDGSTGHGISPSHTYAAAGVYSVTLTVSDGVNLPVSDVTTATVTAAVNLPPTADAGGPYSGNLGNPITFDGSGSNDPEGADLTYRWIFNEDNLSEDNLGSGISPHHTYAAEGIYKVKLWVSDGVTSADDRTTATVVGEGLTLLFMDDFRRPDSSAVGRGWTEYESGNTEVAIFEEALYIEESSDEVNRPITSHAFSPQSAGTLIFEFDFDWSLTGTESFYTVAMQLGHSILMENPLNDPGNQGHGVAVNLVWGNIDGHEMLGYREANSETAIQTVTDDHRIKVQVDFASSSYEVYVDQVLVTAGINFDEDVSSIDTIRFFTDGVNHNNFSGRRFDNIVISSGVEE